MAYPATNAGNTHAWIAALARCESHCQIEVDSLHSCAHAVIGGGRLQALLLAVRFLGTLLHGDDDSDVPLNGFFGPEVQT